MTPAARVAAAIGVLDRMLAGTSVEQALTNWGRANRYAGSGDRHAVRDLVFEAVRCRRSFAAIGGAETGRGIILGLLRANGQPVEAFFNGEGHAPAQLAQTELSGGRPPDALTEAEALDCPDWLMQPLKASLGADFEAVLRTLQHRAPIFLRVNTARVGVAEAIVRLAGEGIDCHPHPLATTAVEVTGNPRKITLSQAYTDGLVELQDAASQAVIEALPLADGMRVLDYCAGGGGKTLAMASRARLGLTAHDANPARLRDLPARAARAGVAIRLADEKTVADAAPFDLVLADVPCSGSGAWRRSPEGKWALTPEKLQALLAAQSSILDEASRLVRPSGTLAYVTCSLLQDENQSQADAFLAREPAFTREKMLRLTPLDGGDGFFCALFRRSS
jgi:16S rRNA (cytosine967-C5)-methyltransferase